MTPVIQQQQVTVRILNQAREVVADLGLFSLPAGVNSAVLSLDRFVPERDRTLYISGGSGGGIPFHGTDDSGAPLSNGYYRVELKVVGGSGYEAAFYLEHEPWAGGAVAIVLPMRGTQATFCWNYPEAVRIQFDVYNLAGELVWQCGGHGQIGQARWDLQSAGGQPIAGGIYVVKSRALTDDGAADDIRILKLAVTR
jgi:hypothetical protein